MSSFIFTQFYQKLINIHPHKPIHVSTSLNTIFSAIEYPIKAQLSENCLKILSDQKLAKKKKKKKIRSP